MLRPGDLRAVLTQLLPVCADWYDIGLALDMSPGTLDAMKVGTYKEPKHCLRDVLKEWLSTSPDPSWEGLVAALKDPIVGKGALARQLETKYCSHEVSSGKSGLTTILTSPLVVCLFLTKIVANSNYPSNHSSH